MNKIKECYKAIQTGKYSRIAGPVSILLAIIIVLAIITPSFLSGYNMSLLLLSAAVYVVLAIGMSTILIAGCIDLSIGAICGLAGATGCFMLRLNVPVIGVVLIAMLLGFICGAFNGFLVTRMGIHHWVATIGTQWIYRGLLYVITGGVTVAVRSAAPDELVSDFAFFGSGKLLGIPLVAYVFIVVGIVVSFILRKTTLGRAIYACGSNHEAATMSGIDAKKTRHIAYMICGTLAGLSGSMLAARLVSMTASGGSGYEFEGLFASVIGGTALSGGEGSVFGAIIGAFIVATLRNGLNLNGINSFWQQVILGALIILVVYYDTMRTKRSREAKN